MDITVILPIHEYNELVNAAIDSFEVANTNGKAKLLICTTSEIKEQISYDKADYLIISDSEPTTFTHLVNRAVDEVKTEYFSILEYDDKFGKNVFVNAEKYLNSDREASVYMTLTEAIDYKDNESIGYINEAVLATSFSKELGYLDIESIKDFPLFNYTGSIFKKSDFVECGKLKESMKLYFWHELALRMLNNNKKFYVVPKVGYYHMVNRPESFYGSIDKTMTKDEVDWWLDTAKNEYMYKTDREKTYAD